ncbi:MAG: 8-amino-7-oxononanoate synthase [Deltaproteobacteria bacterium]|nr:8-amino-7-oxononanoate synthase [Deltaproteobacteria bacterium]
MFEKRFLKRLEIQEQEGLYRNPPEIEHREGRYIVSGKRRLLNFSSNDYLGLGTSEEFSEKTAYNFRKYGTSSGSSRLVSGNHSVVWQAEERCAQHFGYEDTLFFPSGYQANIGVLSTFFEPGDQLIFDKHIHASSVKGIQLSRADYKGYNHSSLSHLEKRLQAVENRPAAVITESLFSMDGDLLNVKGLAGLKERYGFLSIVDEAHAFGALGKNGCGIAGKVADVAIGTFGKAFGFFGAFVLLPRSFKEFLLNFSSPVIYSHAASAVDLLELVSGCDEKREKLEKISILMKKQLLEKGFRVKGDAHILGVEIGDENMAVMLSGKLYQNDIFVFSARHPTVPMGSAILRISMTAMHTEMDVAYFVETLTREKERIADG